MCSDYRPPNQAILNPFKRPAPNGAYCEGQPERQTVPLAPQTEAIADENGTTNS